MLTVRKFQRRSFSLSLLVELGTLSQQAAEFLRECVLNRLNIVVAGGTGSGKTCTLNALLSEVAASGERVITIEDCAELNSGVENIVALEARQPNIEGAGEITIRTLVKNSLRMRPDRLVVGEVRGAEAFDMLQAMNTGHPGSMSTVHSNSPEDAVTRIESMALLVPEMPERVVHDLTPAALDLVVYQRRLGSGRRAVTDISLLEKNRSRGDGTRLVSLFKYLPERGDNSLVRLETELPEWFRERAAWRTTKG